MHDYEIMNGYEAVVLTLDVEVDEVVVIVLDVVYDHGLLFVAVAVVESEVVVVDGVSESMI